MDQTQGRDDRAFGPPPAYGADGNAQNWSSGYNAGNGGVSVVSGQFVNMGFSEGPLDPQHSPPQYIESVEQNVFSEASVRRGFIRKVYLTLMLQLLVTVAIICLFLFWGHLRDWVHETIWFFYSLAIVMPILVIMLVCCDGLRRKVPLNYICLGVFTLVEGAMLGSLAVFIRSDAVLWAMGATALVSFSLTLFSLNTKWDFTMASGSLWVLSWSILSFVLLCAIIRSQFLHILYASLATLLFSLYLVFDTQLIVGGKHRKLQMSPEEYIFAALTLYLDIVMIFTLLLQFMNICR